MKYAFKCRNCGRLETSDQAAEAVHPLACRVCGMGKTAKNWDKLYELDGDTLTKLGLTAEDVEKHIPWQAGPHNEPKLVEIFAEESIRTLNK